MEESSVIQYAFAEEMEGDLETDSELWSSQQTDEMIYTLTSETPLNLSYEELEHLIHNDINARKMLLPKEKFSGSLYCTQESLTLLQAVSLMGYWQFIPLLHQLGADATDSAPLLLALESDEPPSLELFSQIITEQNVNSFYKLRRPIEHAFVMGFRMDVRWDFVESLLNKGARVDLPCNKQSHDNACNFTCDLLIVACFLPIPTDNQQAKSCIEKIIAASASDLDRCIGGVTALEMASSEGYNTFTCELLLKYGASISASCEIHLLKFAVTTGAELGVKDMLEMQAYRCVERNPSRALLHMLGDTDLYGSTHKEDLLNHLVDRLALMTLEEVRWKNGTVDLVVIGGHTIEYGCNIWTTDLVSLLVKEMCPVSNLQTMVLDQSCSCCSDSCEYYESDEMMDMLREMGAKPASLKKLCALRIRKHMIDTRGLVGGLECHLPQVLVDFVHFRHVSKGLVEIMEDAVCKYGL